MRILHEISILMNRILLILFFCADVVIAHAQLSRIERRIAAQVDQNMNACRKTLEQSISINSGTLNVAGVTAAAMHMKREYDAIGFTTEWITLPPDLKRAGHLFAKIDGSKGKRILLIGHLDTVFEPESPFQNYVNHGDTIARGPGTNDMKGGNVVILYVLKALNDLGLLNDRHIVVALHGDEEEAGRPLSISRADIINAAKNSDVALAFETGTGFGEATIARRGTTSWILKVSGRQAHSAGIFTPATGAGAIYETARILNRFYTELREENLTFNPGLILGGTEVELDSAGKRGNAAGKTNIVANSARVMGDLRYLSNEQRERAKTKMKAIVAESLPHTSATITFDDGYPAMPPTPGNLRLLELYSKVSADLGLGPVKPFDPAKRGAGDISFVAEYVDCLDGIGAMGAGAHSQEEYIDLRTLDEQIKRAAIMIYRLAYQ